MSDHAWMELCEVSTGTAESLEIGPLGAVCVQLAWPTRHPELTTVVLQAVPSSHLLHDRTVYLHPLLYEFLSRGASLLGASLEEEREDRTSAFSIAPLPISGVQDFAATHCGWSISRVDELVDLQKSSHISVTCIYHEASNETVLKRQMSAALVGRLISENGMLALPTLSGVCIVVVTIIAGDDVLPSKVYRVGSDFELHVQFVDTASVVRETAREWDKECPGYDDLLQQLIALSQLTGVAAPTGVLLTGCTGVGKSRLASCLAHHVSNMHIHWVSAQDLLVRASWATESDLLDLLLPTSTNRRTLIVLDDLHILETQDELDALRDPELLLVHNSIVVALERLSHAFVLGVCHNALRLPNAFVKIGRLERELRMPPPTQVQREEILFHILQDVKNPEERRRWADSLASRTAGCVASDLRRLCADAWTRAWSQSHEETTVVEITWNDLREAAQSCVPSQLAQLDVTKTAPYPEEHGTPDTWKIHEWSWRNFGGYDAVKKRLFRTVVMPWKRHMEVSGKSSEETGESWVTPPSGVLFHGPPGCGKTLAASCLTSSLGLHVVKVRASDVLDQWLGGSEAAIRSLFARARSASPCVLFFDEIDAIASNRQDEGASVDVTSRVLTTFLNEMDGISSGTTKGGVLVVACTNRLEALDAALLRPGRLDEHVFLEMPSIADVRAMLENRLSKVPLHEDVNMSEIAELLVELSASGADVEGVCRDACSRLIRDSSRSTNLMVSQNDLIAAIRDWRK